MQCHFWLYQVRQIVALLPFDRFSVVRCLELKILTAVLNRVEGVVFALLIGGFLFVRGCLCFLFARLIVLFAWVLVTSFELVIARLYIIHYFIETLASLLNTVLS